MKPPPWLVRRRPAPLAPAGVAAAALFFCWSMTPSLVPRSWAFQGLVSGVSMAAGYGIGVALAHIVGLLTEYRPAPALRQRARLALAILAPAAAAVFLVLGARWQRDLSLVMRADPDPAFSFAGTALLTVAVAALLLGAARALRHLARAIAHPLRRFVPHDVASVAGALLVVVLGFVLLDNVARRALLDTADRVFSAVDDAVGDDLAAPRSALRSGGPGSALRWEELGRQGRVFVAHGPTTDALTAFAGRPAKPPIRVYAGLRSADSIRERAALAVAELERTGAFARDALVVATATGTGWVNPVATAAFEYLHDGDTAVVSLQYSYLPSWLSVLVDAGRAREAGRELFDQVSERWAELPEHRRPKLYVFGESLGSHGGEAAFSGLADIRNRTDGVLWVGPPNDNALWRAIVQRRDPGTPERLPVYDGGATVRFAAGPGDLARSDGPWNRPRVAYLQNPSDPVVWWSPRHLLRRPDWARESDGLHPDVRWYPIVTFWQLTADLARAAAVLDGHGHRYGTSVVDAWAAVAAPPGWSAAQTDRLRAALGE